MNRTSELFTGELSRDGASDSPPWRQRMAIAAILGAMALAVLDSAIANVTLPALAKALNVTAAASIWIVTSYQLGLVVALLPCASLGESIGYRRVFTAGVAVFTLGSGLCAWAPGFEWLVAARFLQGLGGAAIMALGIALLRFTVPHRKLGAAIGWNALVVALSTAAGPTLGAAILTVGTWHCLFAFKIPLGIAVLLAALALPQPQGTGRPVDLISVFLSAGGLAAPVLAVDFARVRPVLAACLLLAAGFSLAQLVRRESPKVAPLVPLDLLQGRPFRLAVVASILCFAGQALGLIALPFYLQHGLGQDLLATGFFMTAWPLAVALAAPAAGRLSNHVAANWLCAAGGSLLAIGLGAAALWPLRGHPTPLLLFTMLCGVGFGLFNVPNNRTLFMQAPRARSGAAGGMQGSARLIGQTAGAVMMALLFTLSGPDLAPRIALALGAALTLAAGMVSLLRHDSHTDTDFLGYIRAARRARRL